MQKKTCCVCHKQLALSAFYCQRTGSFGRQAVCKNCQRMRANVRIAKEKAAGELTHSQRTRQRLKFEVLQHYCDKQIRCAICGTPYIEFLTIDHINGGGCQHRKNVVGMSGLYTWLKRNGYPSGYRVLCFNCNFAVGAYGYSPVAEPERAIVAPPPCKRKNITGVREAILAALPCVQGMPAGAACKYLAAHVGCALGTVYNHKRLLVAAGLWAA